MKSPPSTIYLIPAFLDEEALQVIPAYILGAIKCCEVFFTENERSARRFLKSIWKEMVIDDYQWFVIHKSEEQASEAFLTKIKEGRTIGIISEAGCPGIADPGQLLVAAAHKAGAIVKPLVGPSAVLLALMASGMSGQQFSFCGYLPIDPGSRSKAIKELEHESHKKNCTQVFIETPYRNNQLIDSILKNCKPDTRLCIAANLTGPDEFIQTRTVFDWKDQVPDLHKRPAIFCLYSR